MARRRRQALRVTGRSLNSSQSAGLMPFQGSVKYRLQGLGRGTPVLISIQILRLRGSGA